jgi:3-methyl-2-oxobutanoate hydroxymethyltransferase
MQKRKRPTVADIRALKGRRQLTMLRVESLDEAAAAEEAGIDIVSVLPEVVTHPRYREVAPSLFSMTGLAHIDAGPATKYLEFCYAMLKAGADALYCSASMDTVRFLAAEHVPIVGHVGLVPSRATFTGGFRAVGKTAADALNVYREVKALEAAGAFAAEIEVVPAEIASAISKRTTLSLWSMGAGSGCDAQYLFATDVLGTNRGHFPRHSKAYRDLKAEEDRLQRERVNAFIEYRKEVETGAFPAANHLVEMQEAELSAFLAALDKN